MRTPSATNRARSLRARLTRAEARLWAALRNRRLAGWKWRRQVPIGPYIVDFLCVEVGLVVEVDGATHDDPGYDARRTAHLESRGLRVVRVTNTGVYEGLASVCEMLLAELNKNPLGPNQTAASTLTLPLPLAGEDAAFAASAPPRQPDGL